MLFPRCSQKLKDSTYRPENDSDIVYSANVLQNFMATNKSSAQEVGCWNGGARVGRKCSSSGRPLTPARRSGRVGSRRDPSDGQVSSVVPFFSIPLPRRGAGAFIVSAVDHSYLVTLLLLWPTMSSYPFITLAVLAVRRAFAGRGCRPYLRQVGCTTTGAPHTCIRPVARVGSATSAGQLSEGMMMWRPGQRLSYHSSPPREDLLEAPDEGAEDEVLCLAAGSRWP
ncbi:hypothetical protein GW17_00034117 [Ensete ventricosum]|nr:hypothetical protein GW17_00034117 [Ensete ventricosum]